MRTARRRAREETETFRFAFETWSVEYGLFLDRSARPLLGRCWESQYLIVAGPLRSPSRRKITRIELDLSPIDLVPAKVPDTFPGIGGVRGLSHGCLALHIALPVASFQVVLTAVAAGKLRGCEVSVQPVGRRLSLVESLVTIDPDEPSG